MTTSVDWFQHKKVIQFVYQKKKKMQLYNLIFSTRSDINVVVI